jgi:Tfp pilus assembly protein PilO
MPEPKTTNVLQILQIITMLVGIATLLFAFGSKTEQLNQNRTDIDKLAVAVNDLAKAQASAAVVDALHNKTLEDIQRRLENLERSSK